MDPIIITIIVIILLIFVLYFKKKEGYTAADAAADSNTVLHNIDELSSNTSTLALSLSKVAQQKIDEANEQINELNVQLINTRNQLSVVNSKLDLANRKIADLDKDIASKSIELTAAKSAFENAKSRILSISANVSASSLELEKANIALADAKQKLAEKSEILKAIEIEKIAAEANAARANAEATALNAKLSQIEIAKIEATREAARLKAEKDKREAEDAAAEAKLASLDYLKGYSVEGGYSVSGPTLANYVNMNTNQCARKCDNTPDCIGATYDANTKACFLRGNLDDIRMGFEYEHLMLKGGKAPESSTYSVIKPKVDAAKESNKYYSTTLANQLTEAQKRGVSLANMDYLSNYNTDYGVKSIDKVISESYNIPSINSCARECDLTFGCQAANYNLDSKGCVMLAGVSNAEAAVNTNTLITKQSYDIPLRSTYHTIKPKQASEANARKYYETKLSEQLKMAAAQGIDVSNLNFEGKYNVEPQYYAPDDGNISQFYGINSKNECARKCELSLGCVGSFYDSTTQECHTKSKIGKMSRGSTTQYLLTNPEYVIDSSSPYHSIKAKIDFEKNSADWRKKIATEQDKRATVEGKRIDTLDYLTPYTIESGYQINADTKNNILSAFSTAGGINACARECDLTYSCVGGAMNNASCTIFNELPTGIIPTVSPSSEVETNKYNHDNSKLFFKKGYAPNKDNPYYHYKPDVELTKIEAIFKEDTLREHEEQAKKMGITSSDINYINNYDVIDNAEYAYGSGRDGMKSAIWGVSQNDCAKACDISYGCKGVNYNKMYGKCDRIYSTKQNIGAIKNRAFLLKKNAKLAQDGNPHYLAQVAQAKELSTMEQIEQDNIIKKFEAAKNTKFDEYDHQSDFSFYPKSTFWAIGDAIKMAFKVPTEKDCAKEINRANSTHALYNSDTKLCRIGGSDPTLGVKPSHPYLSTIIRKDISMPNASATTNTYVVANS